jgi:hypothetical protein
MWCVRLCVRFQFLNLSQFLSVGAAGSGFPPIPSHFFRTYTFRYNLPTNIYTPFEFPRISVHLINEKTEKTPTI